MVLNILNSSEWNIIKNTNYQRSVVDRKINKKMKKFNKRKDIGSLNDYIREIYKKIEFMIENVRIYVI